MTPLVTRHDPLSGCNGLVVASAYNQGLHGDALIIIYLSAVGLYNDGNPKP